MLCSRPPTLVQTVVVADVLRYMLQMNSIAVCEEIRVDLGSYGVRQAQKRRREIASVWKSRRSRIELTGVRKRTGPLGKVPLLLSFLFSGFGFNTAVSSLCSIYWNPYWSSGEDEDQAQPIWYVAAASHDEDVFEGALKWPEVEANIKWLSRRNRVRAPACSTAQG